MKCLKCGAPMAVRVVQKASQASDQMNEQRRVRRCINKHSTDTVEVPRAELQSLRARAYMAVRGKP